VVDGHWSVAGVLLNESVNNIYSVLKDIPDLKWVTEIDGLVYQTSIKK
jgi:hypothetical protein